MRTWSPVVIVAAIIGFLGCASPEVSSPLGKRPKPTVKARTDAGVVEENEAEGEQDTERAEVGDGGGVSHVPALHPALALMSKGAGPVLASPKFVAITFPNDPLRAQIEQFVGSVGATEYWKAIATEYGVGGGVAGAPVRLANAAPAKIDDAQIQTFLSDSLAAGTLGAFDPQAIYTIFYPSTTTFTQNGNASCTALFGYHGEASLTNGQKAIYAVVARCPGTPEVPQLDRVTSTTGHELIEAATDPLVFSNFTYRVALPDAAWIFAFSGGEVADLCNLEPDALFKPAGYDFVVQRSWSAKAAAAGHAPCVPAPPGPYFNTAPIMPDVLALNDPAVGPVPAKGIKIAPGQSRTIELALFSDAPTPGEWTLAAHPQTDANGTPKLDFSFDKPSGKNGDKVKLTITVPASTVGADPVAFILSSKLGDKLTLFAGVVGR